MNRGVALNLASIFAMGLSPLINKYALGHISATKASLLNVVFAMLFCWLYAKVRRQPLKLSFQKEMWFVGLTNAAGLVCLYLALDLLSPVMLGLLGRFYLIFTILLSVLLLKEKITRPQYVVIGLAILGAFLFEAGGTELSNVLGMLAAFGYTFLFALTNMMVKIVVKDVDSNSILFSNNAISLVFVLAYVVLRGEADFQAEWAGVGLVFLSSFLSAFLGLLLFYEALKYIDFSKASAIRSISPVLTVAICYPFFPVPLTATNIAGAVLVLGSALWLTFRETRPQANA